MIKFNRLLLFFVVGYSNSIIGQGNFVFSHEIIGESIIVNVEFMYINSTDSNVYFYTFSNPIHSLNNPGVYQLNGFFNSEGYISVSGCREFQRNMTYSSEFLPSNYCNFDTIVIPKGERVRIIQKYRLRAPEKRKRARYKFIISGELYNFPQEEGIMCENLVQFINEEKFISHLSKPFVGKYEFKIRLPRKKVKE